MPNQWKPLRKYILFYLSLVNNYPHVVPIEEIEPHIRRLWKMRKNEKEILRILLDDFINTDKYGLGVAYAILVVVGHCGAWQLRV